MNLAMLRVSGEDAALEKLRHTLGRAPDSVWKKGEPRRHGKVYVDSGLSLTLVDSNTPGDMLDAIREFLRDCKARGIVFTDSSLSSELSIGVTVGDSVQYIAFVDLTAEDLLLLGSLGIALSIAAYPTSDEANANENDA